MTLNRERERFDDPIVLFNNQSLSMSKNSGNNILPLKFLPDEISSSIDLNSTMGVNFSDKEDLFYKVVLLCNVFHIYFDPSSPISPPQSFWKKFRRY